MTGATDPVTPSVPSSGAVSSSGGQAGVGDGLLWAPMGYRDVAGDAVPASGDRFVLGEEVAQVQEQHFGVERSQIEHDFVISHVLDVLAAHRDLFVFYGGTALSRTILNGLRLSEDIDLLATTARAEVAAVLDRAMRRGLQRGFGRVVATPSLVEVARDTQPCVYQIGQVRVQIQLINGVDYTPWPRQSTRVDLRYPGLADPTMSTYTAEGFVGAKTTAWCDQTRNAPRDLYDLWALAVSGHITAEAARVFKRFGPTSGYPRAWMFPTTAPDPGEWYDALGHQCIPQVGPDDAYDTVRDAWEKAVHTAEHD